MGASPQGVDWDEDGDFDLLSGEYNGKIMLFLNIGTSTNPVLTQHGYIEANGVDIDAGSLSVPEVNDWNEDGRKDLIVGCDSGYVYVYVNTGTNSAPQFGGSMKIKADGITIDKNKNCPRIADLNGDGLKDLVLAWIEGSCLFWPNYGTNANPVFYEHYELVGYTDPVDPEPGQYNWSHFCVSDWNEDGRLDLVYTRWESEINVHLNGSHYLDCQVDPVNPPIIIPSQGGSFQCQIAVSNNSKHDAILDGWIEVKLPNGNLYGPIHSAVGVTFTGGGTVQYTIGENVPGMAPAGAYSYRLCLGKMGNGTFVMDSFDFTKL